MDSGGFFPFSTLEENWAYWSRFIWINRYSKIPKSVYEDLFSLVKGKEYFVLTTNVDHCFQRSRFGKNRIFYTQGDYGLWQCSVPCHRRTYDNHGQVREMVESQGFSVSDDGELILPGGGLDEAKMEIPSELVPKCPVCGKPMSMNLRADSTFVEDDGWNEAASRYEKFLNFAEGKKILFLELGVGGNTPGIIKYPFWQMTFANENSTYACINMGEAACPKEIESRSICIDSDIGEAISVIMKS